MLILFHYVSILIFQILQKRKRQKCLETIKQNQIADLENTDIVPIEDLENTIKFDPPVYRQRYAAVYETLIDERWRTKITKLCDFGCAEFGLFIFLKSLNRLNDILFIDIDEEMLKEYVRRIYPLTIEYLKRRDQPLTVNVFAGSVGDPDYRILNTDVVTAIELIEHLYPDTLEAFPYNVFNYAEPKLVIVTTPNADFNILFSQNPKRFRHYDHKFEWTREQFQDWANNIVTRFSDYTVTFTGIGEGPEGTDHFGHCSQMALFIRKDVLNEKYMLKKYLLLCLCSSSSICKETNSLIASCNCICPVCSPKASHGICTYSSYSKRVIDYEIQNVEQNPLLNIFYKAVEKIEYPFEIDNRTEDEKMIDEFRYRINTFGHSNGRFFVEERERSEIPLRDLLYGPDVGCITEKELINLLAKHDYQIEKCIIQETNELETCVIVEPLMDNVTSSSDPSDFDSNSGYFQSVNESISDWDDADADAQPDHKEEKPGSSNQDPTSDSDTLHDALSESESPHPVAQKRTSVIVKSTIVAKTVQKPHIDDQEETDLFEETPSTPSLSSQDNKVHLKRASNVEKPGFIPHPPPLDVNKMKLDFNRINELDRIHNIPLGRNFFGHLLKPQSEKLRKSYLKDRDCLPGPSNLPAKKRKKMKIAGMTSDSEDEVSPLDDMKSVTNCIVENTLNKLDVDVVKANKDDVIEFNTEPANDIAEKDDTGKADVEMKDSENDNNNSRREGIPISQTQLVEIRPDTDPENYTLRLAIDLSPIETHPAFNENNYASSHNVPVPVTVLPNVSVFPHAPIPMFAPENVPLPDEIRDQDEVIQDSDQRSIARASREAIVDPNSVQDLLTDYDADVSMDELNGVDIVDLGNIILVGIHPLQDAIDGQVVNGFPNWLLQILGTQVPMSEGPMEGTLEEPHYYCQGDGLGVHPSVVAVEVEDDDDADHSSQSSNNTTTTDFAEIDPRVSSQDMSSLPEDSSVITTNDNQDSFEENGGTSSVRTDANFEEPPSSSDSGKETSKSS